MRVTLLGSQVMFSVRRVVVAAEEAVRTEGRGRFDEGSRDSASPACASDEFFGLLRLEHNGLCGIHSLFALFGTCGIDIDRHTGAVVIVAQRGIQRRVDFLHQVPFNFLAIVERGVGCRFIRADAG